MINRKCNTASNTMMRELKTIIALEHAGVIDTGADLLNSAIVLLAKMLSL